MNPGDNEWDQRGSRSPERWTLDQLRAGVRSRHSDVGQQVTCSARTAKRDLAELRNRGFTRFQSKPAPGHYRLIEAPNQAAWRAFSAR